MTVDDILKHTWTYANKSVNIRASKSFVATVAMRRIRKASMGVFETDSKRMNYLYRHYRDSDGYSVNQKVQKRDRRKEPHSTRPRRMELVDSGSAASESMQSVDSETVLSVISPLSGLAASPMQKSYSERSALSDSYSYGSLALGSYDRSERGDSMSFTEMVRRYSKTDDDLFELRLPHNMNYTPRDEDGFFVEDIDDFRLNLQRHGSMSRKRKYSQ